MLDKRRLCGAASWSGAPVHLVEAPVYSYAVGTAGSGMQAVATTFN